MPANVWTYGHLTQEQERLLKEAEAALGGKLLLAYEPGQVQPTDLTQSQLDQLHELEQKLGMAVLAVQSA